MNDVTICGEKTEEQCLGEWGLFKGRQEVGLYLNSNGKQPLETEKLKIREIRDNK